MLKNLRNVTELDLLRALSAPCASLGKDGTVPDRQVTGQVTDVLEFASAAGFPAAGTKGKFYVDKEAGKAYEWNGTGYVESPDAPEFIRRMGANLSRKADKVADATAGNLAALDANGNLVDSGDDPGDFVQIGETNIQPWEFDPMYGPFISPLFSVEAGYNNGEEWIQDSSMTFGANVIQMTDIIGSTSLGPNSISVNDGGLSETSTMTGSSVDTPALYVGVLGGQIASSSGIGDIELNESCSVHTPYDEMTGMAYQTSASAILRAARDYESGALGGLSAINFGNPYGTIGYLDDEGNTMSATVPSIVSVVNGWSDGYPVVSALTVANSGTLSLQGGSIEFADSYSGTSYYLGISDAIRIESLYNGTWVYYGYDPSTGGMSDRYVSASDISDLIGAYVNGSFVTSGVNYVRSGQGSLFSVMDDYSYETVFTGRTVEIGSGGSVYTILSDSGVTTMSLELNDGSTSVTLSPSELQQLKALISNP